MGLILAAIIITFIGNTLVLRYFFRQIASSLTQKPAAPMSIPSIFKKKEPIAQEPNEISQVDTETIEFSEENPMELPKNVKFDVEGGQDSFVPPGYEQKTE